MLLKNLCIPESFNTNISQKLFDYKITFVNLQHKTTISKGILYSKTGFKRKHRLRLSLKNFIYKHFRLKMIYTYFNLE